MANSAIGDLVNQVVRDIKGSWRFRWQALVVAWVFCALGSFVVLALPDVYEARTRVFVDTSSRLREVLGTIAFDPDVESRVLLVRQAMLGRPQLQRVATETGLLAQAPDNTTRERMLDSLAETIEITAGRQTHDRNLFTITYMNSDRATSVAVVESLLNAFVEDVIQQKEQGAEAAQQFLRDQITHYADQLALAEERLAAFKRENIGLMPDEGGDYFLTMQTQLADLQQLESNLRVAESRRQELRNQLTGEAPFLPPAGTASPTGQGAAPAPGSSLDVDARIAALQTNLDDLLLRYTEQHPEVVGLREQISQLRLQRAEALKAFAEGGIEDASLATSPVYQSVQMALNSAEVDIAALRAQIADRQAKIADLRARLDTMPQVEAELSRLNRDYANTKLLYDQLVAQLERERLVGEGDEREVVNFQIIDPPMAGVDPVAPRRGLFLLGVLILSLAAGGGAAYLMNMLKPVFNDAEQLRGLVGLPVVGAVSLALDRHAMAAARLRTLGYVGAVGGLVIAAGITFLLKDPGAATVQQWLRTVFV
jgi:polysaccharide chain length determinant protein (PEP-CTERM system associated)